MLRWTFVKGIAASSALMSVTATDVMAKTKSKHMNVRLGIKNIT